MMTQNARNINALLFDKDGTLFEYNASWVPWAQSLIERLAGGDTSIETRLVEAMAFDLDGPAFLPHSPLIACTNREAAERIAWALNTKDIDAVEDILNDEAAKVALVEAVPLAPFLTHLGASGLKLGLMTNDAEATAIAQLSSVKVTHHFDFVAGYDSGFGAKPDPDPLLAFSRHTRFDPARIAMVGDSAHDLIAGRAAGMQTIAVLTGVATRSELSPLADVVLDNIGQIPNWLAA